MAYRVTALRRYPVKSMGGESLDSVAVDARGLAGDRWFAVADDDGRLASGKSSRRFRERGAVFGYRATTAADGAIVVNNDTQRWRVGDPVLDEHLTAAMGARVRVAPEEQTPHHDRAPVSLVGSATLRWCAQRWGINADPRRLRVNLLVETDQPFIEEGWVGQQLQIGSTTLAVTDRAPRCRMIDLDQDGATAAGAWLKPLAAERDMLLAVYADVPVPGRISVGDTVPT